MNQSKIKQGQFLFFFKPPKSNGEMANFTALKTFPTKPLSQSLSQQTHPQF